MKVSLVATVLNGGLHLAEFLDSVHRQTHPPDEVVVVDGGSTDGTFDILQRAEGVVALREPGANIARGRNVAVRAAAHDLIAVSDADCVLAPDWLERIIEPLERDPGVQVVGGFYRPLASSFLETCMGAVSLPEPGEVRPGWMPSSRSVAFRREPFEAAGGYPEWLDIGEDMYLNHRWVQQGVRIELAPQAVAYWRVRPTLAETWRQYSRYAEGDAIAGMYPERHLVRFGAYAAGALALASRRRRLMAMAALGAAVHAARPIRRAQRRLASPWQRGAAIAAVPAALAFIDAAKMWGYLRGLRRSGRES